MGVVGGGDQRGVGPGRRGIVGRRGGVEPVAELEPLVPEMILTGQLGDLIDPRPHAVVLPPEQLDVAEPLVQHPRHDDRGIAPRRRRQHREEELDPRDVRRHGAELALLGGEVLQPRGEEAPAVVEERRRRCEHLDVSGPAEPLVALRAVRRQIDEVAAHAPADVLVQLVEPVVRAVERAGRRHVAVADDGLDRVRGQVAGPAVDLDVAEPVDRERRLVRLDVPAGEDVAVGRGRLAQRPGRRARRARAPRRGGASPPDRPAHER